MLILMVSLSFNPRTHTGATTCQRDNVAHSPVSIHAPIRVRPGGLPGKVSNQEFQSTHPYGCDPTSSFIFRHWRVSIHAPIRVRRYPVCLAGSDGGFNPRTHTGATSPGHCGCFISFVSIHAPIRVRRDLEQYVAERFTVSIHAPIRVRRWCR